MSSPVASVGLVDSLPLAPSSSGGSSPTTPPIATRGPDTELMDTLNDTSMDDNSTHPLDDVPNHLHHTVVVMTADDFGLLREILDRAQSILHSSPSADDSLSFLRLIAAYDQILMRHDIAPTNDNSVFQWLVTLNIATDDELRTRAGDGAGRASTHTKTYDTWMHKLTQLYDSGEKVRRDTQVQITSSSFESHLHGDSSRSASGELSLSSLESASASFASPHVTFANQPIAESQLRSSTGAGILKQSTNRASNGAPHTRARVESSDLLPERHPAAPRPAPAEDDEDAHEEQAFRDLFLRKNKSPTSPSFAASASPAVRERAAACFAAWRQQSRPRFLFMQRVGERHAHDIAAVSHECLRVWHSGMQLRRYDRYLTSLERTHRLGLTRNLLLFWHAAMRRRRLFTYKKQLSQVLGPFRRWRDAYASAQHRKQLHLTAVRGERWLRWKSAVVQWRHFHKRQSHRRRQLEHADALYRERVLARMWTNWCRLRASTTVFVLQARHHLLRLREHQSLLHWISHTRRTHMPQQQATLTVQQFHILWRWCTRSFGGGYDIMRIIRLSKMNYQSAVPADDEHEQQRYTRPNPNTHPFIDGPSSTTSFAATASAPFAGFASYRSDHFSQSMPHAPLFAPAASTRDRMTNADAPVLGSPLSTLDVAPSPHADPQLPLRHAILTLLNHSLLFRQHKLPHLMDRIQLWAKWYIKHLFKHWRANIVMIRQQREQEKKRLAIVAADLNEAEERVVALHTRNTLACVFDQWQDTFHKASYYSLLFRNFKQRQYRRLVTAPYVQWKYSFVSLRAQKLFRLQRGVAALRAHVKSANKMKRKFVIVRYSTQRNLVALVWQHWRLTRDRAATTKRGMLAMLWRQWKEHFMLSRQRAQDARDADIYYSLKLAAKNLLTWRALTITQAIAGKYAHRAVHHHHQTLTHRHIVWWVNWTRYRKDSKRLAQYGRDVYVQKLKDSAVRLWKEMSLSKAYRHAQFRTCRAVRNKHLAHAAVQAWKYAMACAIRTHRIRRGAVPRVQGRAWLRWLEAIRLKNLQYDQLESHVALRRDYNALGVMFFNWLQCTVDQRKAQRLQRHCEIVWYFAYIKRLFRAWKYVSHEVHQDQLAQADQFRAYHLLTSRRRALIQRWRGVCEHQAQYDAIIDVTRAQLMNHHQLPHFYRIWRSQAASSQEARATARTLERKQGVYIMRHCFARWSRSFVGFAQRRKVKLDAICGKLRLAHISQAVQAWVHFRNESRLQVPAIAFHRRLLLVHTYRRWRAALQAAHHQQRADAWAQTYDTKRIVSRIYTSWRGALRATRVHRLFLYQKTFLAWTRYVRLQREQRRIARHFRDTFHIRRMRFMFRVWQRYGKQFVAKQRRRLAEKHRCTITADHADRIRTWHRWSAARMEARQRMADMRVRSAELLLKGTFAHWWQLYQKQLWARSMEVFAARTHRQSTLLKAVHHLAAVAARTRNKRAVREQAQAIRHRALETRLYRVWQQRIAARRAYLATVIRRFEQPRLRATYLRWRSVAGRRSRILDIHQAYLSRTLQTWRENARASYRERVWYPLADAANVMRLKRVVLGHWRKYRTVHRAYLLCRPKATLQLKRDALQHWVALFHLRLRITHFEETVQRRNLQRARRRAIRVWRRRVTQRQELIDRLQRFHAALQRRTARRCHAQWYRRLMMLRSSAVKSDAYFLRGPCRRVLQTAYDEWRSRFVFLVQSHAIHMRGVTYEQQVTNTRKQGSRLTQWMQVASYAARVERADLHLTAAREHRTQLRAFQTWRFLFRRFVGARRMHRLKSLRVAREAMDRWTSAVDVMRKHDAIASSHIANTKRAHLHAWWHRMKKRQKDRIAVQLLQSRIKVKSTSDRGADSWQHAKQIMIPVFRQWIGAISSVKFYMQMWRRYNHHCRSYRDSHDLAALHYSRSVLLPSSWREWKRSLVESQQSKKARACRLRHAKKRFIANLAAMMQRRFIRDKYAAKADQMQRRICTKHAWDEWKEDTMRILDERAAIVHASQVKFFAIWLGKLRTRKLTERKMQLATQFHQSHLIRSSQHHWKSYWLHLVLLESRSAIFHRKLQQWSLGRLFTAWVDRLRRRAWRRQRTQLILTAVRTIWQKNAFLAWHRHVLGLHQQRREFLLARVLYAWKFLTKRARSRRFESAEDERVMQQMEMARLESMPRDLREARLLANTPKRAPLQIRARSEERAREETDAYYRLASASATMSHAGRRGSVALSASDLEDAPLARLAATDVGAFATHIPAPAFFPSTDPLRSSPTALAASMPLNQDLQLPRLTVADQQWRLTPFRSDDDAARPIAFDPTRSGTFSAANSTRPRAASHPSPTLADRLPLFESTSYAQLAASVSAANPTGTPTRSATSSPVRAARTPNTAGMYASPRRTLTPTDLSPPRSRSHRRQNEMEEESKRQAEQAILTRSPATHTFVARLFAD